MAQLFTPEGINDFLHAECFTFSTVAQTWSFPTDLPGIWAPEIGTDCHPIPAAPIIPARLEAASCLVRGTKPGGSSSPESFDQKDLTRIQLADTIL